MKKFLLKTFVMLLCMGFSSWTHAQDFVRDGILYEVYDERGVMLLCPDEGVTITDLVIPATVKDDDDNEYIVYFIGWNAFEGRSDIRTVVFGENVHTLCCDAFKNCENLQSVTLNEGLVEAEWWCFDNTQITELTIPSTLNYFHNETFGGMSQLTKITWMIDDPWGFRNHINLRNLFSGVNLSQVELYLPETADAQSFADEGWNNIFKSINIQNRITINIREDGDYIGSILINDEEPEFYGMGTYEVDEDLAFNLSMDNILYLPYLSVDGAVVELVDGAYTLTADGAAHLVQIWWEMNPNAILNRINVGANGYILVNGEETNSNFYTISGDDIVLTLVPDEGYRVKTLTVGGADVTEQIVDNQYTISGATQGQTISVTFEDIVPHYQLTARINNGYFIEDGNQVSGINERIECTIQRTITFSPRNPEGYVPFVYINSVTEEGTETNIELTAEDLTYDETNGTYSFTVGLEERGTVNVEVYFEELPVYEIYGEVENGEFVIEDDYTDMWLDIHQYVGKSYTYTFFGYEEGYVPRAILGKELSSLGNYNEIDVTDQLTYDEETGFYTFTVQMDEEGYVNLRVEFVENKAYFEDNYSEFATITFDVDDLNNIPVGSDVTITVSPDEGYVLSQLFVDGVDVTDQVVDGQYVIHQITFGHHDVNAFAKLATIAFNAPYMTFCNAETTEFPLTGSVKAWIVSGYDNENVHLTRVEVVPAGMGVLLQAEVGTSFDIIYSNKYATYANLLVGTTSDIILSTQEDRYYNNTRQGGYNFVFAEGSKGYGFYKLSSGGNFEAGKAYLWLPAAAVNNAGVKAFNLQFEEDEATGIQQNSLEQEPEQIYSIDGRRVQNTAKGIYIVNGKKILK